MKIKTIEKSLPIIKTIKIPIIFIKSDFYKQNINQIRFIRIAISEAINRKKIDSSESYKIFFKEYSKLFKIGESSSYEALDKIVKNNINHEIKLLSGSKNKRIPIISEYEYVKGRGHLRYKLSKKIIPYISNINSDFINYNIKNIALMKSTYSIKLYELFLKSITLTKNNKENHFVFEIKEFKELLGIKEKYQDITLLKKKIIAYSLKEINNLTNLKVDIIQYKEGKTITHFQFNIKRK